MKSLISAELLKLRTTFGLWVAAGVSIAFAAMIPIAAAVAPKSLGVAPLAPSTLADFLRAPAQVTGGAVLLIGLLAAAAEYRHGTVVTTRLVEPRNGRVLTAKLAASGLAGLGVGAAVELIAAATGVAGLMANGVGIEPLSNGVPRIALVVPIVVALHALLGVAVGSLFRNTAAAVGVTAVWWFVLEGILPAVSRHPEIANWLPGGTAEQTLAAETAPGALPPVAAAALLLGYVVLLVASTLALDRRRELKR